MATSYTLTIYLLENIGTGARATDGGLCRAVLDKCQYYTYKENQYVWDNDIVVNYIQRAMVNIRAAQQNIISDYASNCMVDVAQCYNNQVTQVNTWSSSASINSIYDVMRGACRNVALTCGYAIFAGPPALDPTTEKPTAGCSAAATATNDATRNNAYVNCISEIFYESLLCPANSGYETMRKSACTGTGCSKYVNEVCKCLDGYEPVGKQCMKACDTTAHFSGKRDAYNNCLCADGYKLSGGQCIKDSAE